MNSAAPLAKRNEFRTTYRIPQPHPVNAPRYHYIKRADVSQRNGIHNVAIQYGQLDAAYRIPQPHPVAAAGSHHLALARTSKRDSFHPAALLRHRPKAMRIGFRCRQPGDTIHPAIRRTSPPQVDRSSRE
jgi:hypothetical protein